MVKEDVITALVGGRAIVSCGAFARVSVNGAAVPGDDIQDTDGEIDVHLHIEALPEIDVTHVKVLANCDEVANVAATDPSGVVKLDTVVPVTLTEDSAVIVLAFGADPMPVGMPGYNAKETARATTNAIYVDVDGNGIFDHPGGHSCNYTLDPPAP